MFGQITRLVKWYIALAAYTSGAVICWAFISGWTDNSWWLIWLAVLMISALLGKWKQGY